jgi:hypothetical protein
LVPDGNFPIHAELIGAPDLKPWSGVIPAKKPAGGFRSFFRAPAQTARSIMRIRYELFVASAVTFTMCLAGPAEAAKKQRARAPTAYADSTSCAGATWGTAGRGPICNGQDYIGQDPDINVRAYILKDFGSRYGGTF